MKFGFSIYSLYKAMSSGEMTVEDAFAFCAENDGDHIEIVDFGVNETAENLAKFSKKYNLPISAYSIGSALAQSSGEDYEKELAGVKSEIDKAHIIGATLMRCDLVKGFSVKDNTGADVYDSLFSNMVKAAQEISDYALQYEIDIAIENHGYLVNGADRIKRLIMAVDRKNYGCILDIGNSLCVDEDPIVTIDALLPFAKRIHIKDFYVREDGYAIGAKGDTTGEISWITTNHNRFLRGAIVGHGDINMREAIQKIIDFGYDGDLTIEFEGAEESKLACRQGMKNLRHLVSMCKES